MFPLLSLSQITIDPDLARRLPRRLAYYHLAMPIAEDEDNITLAMAYPENKKVVDLLAAALGTPVTPVRSFAEDIKRALDNIWREDGEAAASSLITWTDTPDQQTALRDYALSIAQPLALLTLDEPLPDAVEPLLACVRDLRPALVVCSISDPQALEALLTRSPASMLLVRGTPAPPQSILLVLRGHTPDRRALDWIAPIARHYGAQVTLLMAATSVESRQGNPLISNFANLLLPDHPARLTEFGQILTGMNVRGRIKIREGALEDVIAAEVASVRYELVAIATEAHGDFVHRVLRRLSGSDGAFLILKP